MEAIILESKDISFDAINQLMESIGCALFFQTPEKWQRVLDVSTHIAYIKEDNQLIAFGRIVEDGMMCMFYDICVHPNYQRQGLGTLIMKHLIDKIKDKEYISIGLFTWEENSTVSEFYRKLGFEPASAMLLKKYANSKGP